MRLTTASSLLMLGAPSALASQFSPFLTGEIHEAYKSMKALNGMVSHGISTYKNHDQRRTQQCEDVGSEEFWQVMDIARFAYYDEIECSADATECTWDLSEPASNGSFDLAAAVCQEDGGILYTIDAEITCDDGTTSTIVANPLTCLSGCSPELIAMFSSLIPAGSYAGKEEDVECSWVSLQASAIEVDDDITFDDDTMDVDADDDDAADADDDAADADDFSTNDDGGAEICASVESEALDQALMPVYIFGAPECDESEPPECKVDFSPVIDSGLVDSAADVCNDEGGELYMMTFETDCGTDGKTYYNQIPQCLKSCDVAFFSLFIVEGGEAGESLTGESCTFIGNESEAYVYGGNEEGDDGLTIFDDDILTNITFDDDIIFTFDDDEDDDTSSGGVCEPVQDMEYQMSFFFFVIEQGYGSCEDESQLNCTLDLTSALEGDMMDGFASNCTSLGGGFFVATATTDCGENGVTTNINVPTCATDCSVDILAGSVIVEGADNGGGCIFTEVGEIYLYGSDTTPTDDVTDGDDAAGDDMAPKSPKSTKMTKATKAPKSTKMTKTKSSKSVKKTGKKSKAPKSM